MEGKSGSPSSKFKGLVLHGVNDVRYEEMSYDFDNLDKDLVLVKINTAALGPYELGFVIGRLKMPGNIVTNLGVEGAGVVVKASDSELVGKRVAVFVTGIDHKTVRTFAEYAVVHKDSIVELPDNVDDNQGAYIMANPVTAYCLFSQVISKHKAVVLDTASSALGKMIIKLCVKNGIKIINIVRRDENIKMLNDLGSNYTFNSNSSDFWQNLSAAIEELHPSLYVTFLGGGFPSQIFDKLPKKATMCTCGNINNELLSGFSSTDFIFKGKIIIGFQVLHYLAEISAEEKAKIYKSILDDLASGDKIYYTDIAKEFPLNQWDEARKYYESNMSKGKIILKPSGV